MATEISSADLDFHIWDKGQLIFILTRNKFAKDTIFVGIKQGTLDALKTILLSRTQWTDYIEHVLNVITVSEDTTTERKDISIMSHNDYPFRICDLSLPSTRTGFVYFFISVQDKTFTYIGQTICIHERLPQNNSGYGSFETCPNNIRPYTLTVYICGCRIEGKEFKLRLEIKWKIHRDSLIFMNNNDPPVWAKEVGQRTINEAIQTHQASKHDLKLVLLYKM